MSHADDNKATGETHNIISRTLPLGLRRDENTTSVKIMELGYMKVSVSGYPVDLLSLIWV